MTRHFRYHTQPMMMSALLLAALVAQAAPSTIDIVSVIGCLKEPTPNNWVMTSATEPVPSSANAPPAKDIPATPPTGKNEYKLIGVSEFNLPAHKDHTVLVKGLYIKATPTSRLNITSVTTVAPACVAAAK
jgi:hypothetical protein